LPNTTCITELSILIVTREDWSSGYIIRLPKLGRSYHMTLWCLKHLYYFIAPSIYCLMFIIYCFMNTWLWYCLLVVYTCLINIYIDWDHLLSKHAVYLLHTSYLLLYSLLFSLIHATILMIFLFYTQLLLCFPHCYLQIWVKGYYCHLRVIVLNININTLDIHSYSLALISSYLLKLVLSAILFSFGLSFA
jgi:hypothetical protein